MVQNCAKLSTVCNFNFLSMMKMTLLCMKRTQTFNCNGPKSYEIAYQPISSQGISPFIHIRENIIYVNFTFSSNSAYLVTKIHNANTSYAQVVSYHETI